jgi:hypothetical protein
MDTRDAVTPSGVAVFTQRFPTFMPKRPALVLQAGIAGEEGERISDYVLCFTSK